MNETKNTKMDLYDNKEVYKKIAKNRLDKYMCKAVQKKYNQNELIIKNGEALLSISGSNSLCKKVEGYLKLPGTNIITNIKQSELVLLLPGKNKLIMPYNNNSEIICRGYKKDNLKDFMLLLYAETELDYLLVIDITNGDTLPLSFQGDSDNNHNAKILYDQFKYAIEKETNILEPMIGNIEGRGQYE